MDLRKFIGALPKTETHLHIEGALPWEFLVRKDPVRFTDEPVFRSPDFRYDNFAQFESILIDHAMEIFSSPQDYHDVAKSIFNSLLDLNVRYLETSFHAGMIEFLGVPGQEILHAILSAVPVGLEVRVFLGISRNAYTDYLAPKLESAVESWEGLSGIDLHGPEDLPLDSWTEPLWAKAKHNGLVLKAHAGEFGPASNIEHAISNLGVKRIQHGVAAIKSESLMQKLLDDDVCLDMCPISNFKLRVIDEWIDHPLGDFLNRGIKCTLSTDDPLSFNNNLVDEYMACSDKLSMPVDQLITLVKNGFGVSSLTQSEKNTFYREIDLLWDDFKGNGVG